MTLIVYGLKTQISRIRENPESFWDGKCTVRLYIRLLDQKLITNKYKQCISGSAFSSSQMLSVMA